MDTDDKDDDSSNAARNSDSNQSQQSSRAWTPHSSEDNWEDPPVDNQNIEGSGDHVPSEFSSDDQWDTPPREELKFGTDGKSSNSDGQWQASKTGDKGDAPWGEEDWDSEIQDSAGPYSEFFSQ